MKCAYGATRYVILTEKYAIKIARFPALRLVLRGFYLLSKGKALQRPREVYGSVTVGIVKYFLCGVLVNIDECQLWQELRNKSLAPTLFSILGLVNVQIRGAAVEQDELDRAHPFPEIAREVVGLDLDLAKQYCRINGAICLADYGSPLVVAELRARFSRRRLVLA